MIDIEYYDDSDDIGYPHMHETNDPHNRYVKYLPSELFDIEDLLELEGVN